MHASGCPFRILNCCIHCISGVPVHCSMAYRKRPRFICMIVWFEGSKMARWWEEMARRVRSWYASFLRQNSMPSISFASHGGKKVYLPLPTTQCTYNQLRQKMKIMLIPSPVHSIRARDRVLTTNLSSCQQELKDISERVGDQKCSSVYLTRSRMHSAFL